MKVVRGIAKWVFCLTGLAVWSIIGALFGLMAKDMLMQRKKSKSHYGSVNDEDDFDDEEWDEI